MNNMIYHMIDVVRYCTRRNNITPLGRWKIVTNKTQLDLKINYANEDHCGVCSEYITPTKKDDLIVTNIETEYYKYMIIDSKPDTNIPKN